MNNTLKTLVFFGNERLVSGLDRSNTPVLRALIKAGYTVAAIVSHHTDGVSRSNRKLEVADIAKQHNIPLLLPKRPSEIIDQLKAYNADAAILAAYGRIIPQSILDIFPKGIINIHPSLLPKYRGPTPIESAIINGDLQTGVSIMQLTAGMDEGPIYGQVIIPLEGDENKFELHDTLAAAGANKLIEILPAVLDGTLHPTPQNSNNASYCALITKSDSLLSPELHTAAELERKIRAHLGYPKTKTEINGYNITITKASVTKEHLTDLDIACKDDMVLSIDELVAPNGKRMSAEAFLRGYGKSS